MILEATRLWVDQGIKHATTGVNALLAEPGFPLAAGDTLPPNVECFDWTRHGWAARLDITRERLPKDKGSLIIVRASDIMETSIPGNPELRGQQPNVVLAALYVGQVDAKTEKTTLQAEQDASYTLRAVLRSTALWIENSEPNDRALSQCRLVELTDFNLATFPVSAGVGFVAQAAVVAVRMTDMYAERVI